MPTFIYPAAGEGGAGGVDGSPSIVAGNPSTRQYDTKTLASVKLPEFTVTGDGVLTAVVTLQMGSGGFTLGGGTPMGEVLVTGSASSVSTDLSSLEYVPSNSDSEDVLYSIEVEDSEGRKGTADGLKIVNSQLLQAGNRANTTVTIGGSSGSIRLLVNGKPASNGVNYSGSLGATVAALVSAINGFSGSPKFSASQIGDNQIKIEAPLAFGSQANGLTVTADVSGTMSINAGAKLSGGITKTEPELDWTGKLLKTAKEILPTAAGAVATNLILRNMSKVEVEVTVENEEEQPDISVLYDCQLVLVPAGYTPPQLDQEGNWTAAVYPATWDYKTFGAERVWTANPAWCWLDLLTNKRYGAGNAIPLNEEESIRINKQVWEASKRCDEFVRTGYGSEMEPRYAIHTLINEMTRKDALESVASVFDASVIYTDNGIHLRMDRPDVAKRLVTNANVGAGEFKYTGGSLAAMYNWVDVSFNNPDKFYNLETVFAYDMESITKFGEKKTAVHAFGCASESQAKRKARYIMLNEKSNPLVVTYVASWDHHDIIQGDLVAVIDNSNKPAGSVYAGGRVSTSAGSTVTLDRVISGSGYLHVTMSDGSIQRRQITSTSNSGNKSTVTLASAISGIEKGAVWFFYAENLDPVTFKVIQKTERSTGIWEISAVAYDPTKYPEMDKI